MKPRKLKGDRIEGHDCAASEIANEKRVAELTEVFRRKRDAPRRIEPIAVLKLCEEFSAGAEDIYEAQARTVHFIFFLAVLFRVRHD